MEGGARGPGEQCLEFAAECGLNAFPPKELIES
jgi:hypothetical protein